MLVPDAVAMSSIAFVGQYSNIRYSLAVLAFLEHLWKFKLALRDFKSEEFILH